MKLNSYAMFLSAILLSGCGGEEFQDLREFVQNAGADMRGKVEAPPEIKPYEPFNYNNSAGLPDPFKPRKQEVRSANRPGLNQPNFDRPKQELEEYPLDTLKVVGYLQQNNVGFALIRTLEGKIHRVMKGNYIGQNFGKVILITEAEIKISETVQDSSGDWSVRESSLQLVSE